MPRSDLGPSVSARRINFSGWAVGVAMASLGIATQIGCSATSRAGCDKPFDRAGWNRSTSVEPTVDGRPRRAILVDRLLACDTLIAAPSTRVRELLGEPDRKSQTDDGARLWVYVVGPGALGLRSEELVVRFEQRRVARTYRTR